MNIPDLISPIVAYRTWQWDAEGLKSLNCTLWVPGEAMTAACSATFRDGSPFNIKGHESPFDHCTCGVYAAKDFKHLVRIGYVEYGIHGEVNLWGKVWDHKLGYRAQFAYPKTLVIPQDMLPVPIQQMLDMLAPLQLYGVPLYFTPQRTKVDKQQLLWTPADGYKDENLEWLVRRGVEWYDGRRNVLSVGDRVAIKDKGIGVCTQAEDKKVWVTLFNKTVYSLERKNIDWNDQNNRWETDKCGFTYVAPRPATN